MPAVPSTLTIAFNADELAGTRKRRMAKQLFMQSAVKPSHKGKFAAKAKKAGKSTEAYAEDEKHAPGTLGREARLALIFNKFRPGKKKAKGGGMRSRLSEMRKGGAFSGKKRRAA